MQTYLLEFYVVGLGVVLLLWEAFGSPKKKSTLALIGAGGLTIILGMLIAGSSCPSCTEVPAWLSRFYTTSGNALFFKGFALVCTILVLLMSYDFRSVLNKFTCNDHTAENTGEFYILPLFACAGLMWMASATDLVSIFVSLELVTITFYIMVAFMRRNVGSLEAGVKYLILGALSTGFLVYGIAWLYGATGTTNLSAMHIEPCYTLYFGLSLIILSLAFKIGAVPMQLWIPDVYQGAPTPITAFLSVASKAAGFCIAITILTPFLKSDATGATVTFVLVVIASATLLYGNLTALSQTNFKRLLAYSSIAHAGFILMGLAAARFDYVMFYLATYLVMTFAAFFILSLVRSQDGSDEINALDGLGKRNPHLALALTIIMAGMAGVPLTAGFIGKFLMFQAAVNTLPMYLIIVAFIGAAAGFYYYFQIIKAIYWHAPAKEQPLVIPAFTKYAVIILTAATIILGIYPKLIEPLLALAS